MPDMEMDKVIIFALLGHDNSKQLPAVDCMWDKNDSQRLPTFPCAELD
jgi:hypothetical protein